MKIHGYFDRTRQGIEFDPKEKLTEQNHAKACDINTIMAKYQKTGLIDHMNRHAPTYGDVSSADFQTAQNLVAQQKTIFEELPSSVRDHYDNDVTLYLDAVQTEEGVRELSGLLTPKSEKEPEPEPEPTPETEPTGSETVTPAEPGVT